MKSWPRLPGLIACAALAGVMPWPVAAASKVPAGRAVGTPDAVYEELLDLTGVLAAARAAVPSIIERLRAENPDVPEAVWSTFSARIADRDGLVSIYAPVYARHVAVKDARDLLAFYHGALGKRVLQVMPKIEEECRAGAQARAAAVVAELLGDTADNRGTDLPRGPEHIESARVESIRELLRASGALAQAQQSMRLMIDLLQRMSQDSQYPAAFWRAAGEKLQEETALLQIWTPAYARYLPDEDVRGLLHFYRSPAGARYVAALPAIQNETLEAATQFANVSARRTLREVLGPLPQVGLQHPQIAPGGSKATPSSDGQ